MDDIVHRVKERKEVSIGYMITLFHDEDLRKEGRKEGHSDIFGLYGMLKLQDRSDEFEKAMEDASVLDALLEEYYAAVKS